MLCYVALLSAVMVLLYALVKCIRYIWHGNFIAILPVVLLLLTPSIAIDGLVFAYVKTGLETYRYRALLELVILPGAVFMEYRVSEILTR